MKNGIDLTKKSLLTASLVGLVVAFSNNANAEVTENAQFYVGIGAGGSKYSMKGDFKNAIENTNKGSIKSKSGNVLIPLLGIKFKENFGVEFGYEFHSKLKISGTKEGHLHSSNSFIDIIGCMPTAPKVDLLGGLGVGRMMMKEDGSVGAMGDGSSYTKFGLRVKFGAQYNLSNNWSVRGLVNYQKVGSKSGKHAINSMMSVSMDVIYLI